MNNRAGKWRASCSCFCCLGLFYSLQRAARGVVCNNNLSNAINSMRVSRSCLGAPPSAPPLHHSSHMHRYITLTLPGKHRPTRYTTLLHRFGSCLPVSTAFAPSLTRLSLPLTFCLLCGHTAHRCQGDVGHARLDRGPDSQGGRVHQVHPEPKRPRLQQQRQAEGRAHGGGAGVISLLS